MHTPVSWRLPLVLLCALLAAGCAAPAAPAASLSAPATQPVTSVGETAQPAPPPASDPNMTITLAIDTYPSLFPGLLVEAQGLLQQRGYDLRLVPLYLDGKNTDTTAQRFERLKSGEWDVLATPLESFARAADPTIGAVTAVVSESAGADKIIARRGITTLNDLKGKRIAVAEGGVSEFFMNYTLNLAGLSRNDVTVVGRDNVAGAVRAFIDGDADVVVGWDPDVLAAEQDGGNVLVTSDQLRVILDVLVSSRPALTNKPAALQAFHDAWFEALRLMIDQPQVAGETIVAWGHPEWTLITRPEDLQAQLTNIAQATLGANKIAFDANLVSSRIAEANQIWNPSAAPLSTDTLASLIDGNFVLASARKPALLSQQPPTNSSFLLTARVELPQASEAASEGAPIAELPVSSIDFDPETTQLTDEAREVLREQVVPVLRTARLYLLIEGSAAWPGPTGRYTAEEIKAVARDRAVVVAAFLSQQGIDPNRLAVGTVAPACQDCMDQSAMDSDRFVRLTLVQGGR